MAIQRTAQRKKHFQKTDRSKKIETYLEIVNCKSYIHKKGYRNKTLNAQQQFHNRIKSKIRSHAKYIFGFVTNSINNALNLRAIGKTRIDSLIALLNLTHNLCRYEQLVRLQKIKII